MKKIMLFFAVACILAACNNDNEVLNETQYITEFKAVFGGADTRMTATADNGLKFAWEDGDKLYVFQAMLHLCTTRNMCTVRIQRHSHWQLEVMLLWKSVSSILL